MQNDYTIYDLINPEIEEFLGDIMLDISHSKRLKLIQQHLSNESKFMIDAIHMFLCRSNNCKYYTEESMEYCWSLPAHVEYARISVSMMNACGFGPGQFTTCLAKYLKVIEVIKGPGPVHELVKHAYFGPEAFLSSMQLFHLDELSEYVSDST